MNAIRTIVTVELKNDLSRCSRMYVCVSIDPPGALLAEPPCTDQVRGVQLQE